MYERRTFHIYPDVFNRPVDTLAKEAAIAERLEKEREQVKERIAHHSMSRTSSRNASHRGETRPGHGSPVTSPTALASPKAESKPIANTANVRPSFSFASAAAGKKDASDQAEEKDSADAEELADKVADVQI